MTGLISQLYLQYIDAGYSCDSFWTSGLDEIRDCLNSYIRRMEAEEKRRDAELKSLAEMLYTQALQIGNIIGSMMPSRTKVEIYPLSYYYPRWFKDAEKPDAQMLEYKARMENFVHYHNMRFEQTRG